VKFQANPIACTAPSLFPLIIIPLTLLLILIPIAASCGSLNIPGGDVGLSFGNSRNFTGLRLNLEDRDVDRINGISFALWHSLDSIDTDNFAEGPNPDAEYNGIVLCPVAVSGYAIRGVGAGLIGVAASEIHGVGAGMLGAGADIFNGVGFGGLGVGGDELTGVFVGGLGVGGDSIDGIAFGGLARSRRRQFPRSRVRRARSRRRRIDRGVLRRTRGRRRRADRRLDGRAGNRRGADDRRAFDQRLPPSR